MLPGYLVAAAAALLPLPLLLPLFHRLCSSHNVHAVHAAPHLRVPRCRSTFVRSRWRPRRQGLDSPLQRHKGDHPPR